MSSSISPDVPRNSLLSIRETTNNMSLRSLSTKESSFSDVSYTPPRLSTQTYSNTSPDLSSHNSDTVIDHTISHESSYQCVSSILKKDGDILSIAMSNNLVYIGSYNNLIKIWKLPEFRKCGQLKSKACMVVALEVASDRIYAAYGDGKVRVWLRTWTGSLKHVRLATIPWTGGDVLRYFIGKNKTAKHMAPITSLAINISDDILYTASLDKIVKAWRLSDLKCIDTIQAHSEVINAIAVSDDGLLYTGSDDATIRVWRRNFCRGDRPHSLTTTLTAKYSPVKALTIAQCDGVLYGGCTDGYIHYWHKGWFSGQLEYGGAIQGHDHAIMCITSVAKYMISGSADATSRVWVREASGKHSCLAVLIGHRGPVRCVSALSGTLSENDEDGCKICTGSLDGVVKVWRVTQKVN